MANAFKKLIENWHISNFHINLSSDSKDIAGYSDHLSVTGDNLQLIASRLYQSERPVFEKIIEQIKKAPGIDNIEPEATRDGRLLLKFQDGSFKDPFVDEYVSNGTIKTFAYITLL